LTPYNYELFEFNKMLTVYFLTTIIATSWIIKMLLSKQIIYKRTSFAIPLLIFLISQVISSLLSIDSHTSVWGYYSRFHGGLLSTISYLILFFAYVTFGSELRSSSEPSKFNQNTLKVILSTGLIVSIYGILEHFGIDSHLWVQDVQNRVFSTLGQPNWLAAYLIALIPISTSLSIKKPLYHLVSLTFFITLLFTKSRSGLLGLAVAWLIFWLLTLLKNKLKSFPYKPFIIINLLFLISIFTIGTPFTQSIRFRTSTQFGTLDSSVSPSDLGPPAAQIGGSKSSDIRKVVWQGAIDIFQEYPVFGSGTETFAYAYYNHRPIEHNLLSEWDFLYNKAHNEFLNYLSTTGLFGLLSYCLMIIWFIVISLKNLKSSPIIPALLAGFLGLSVSNFFGFSVVPVALFFFLFPAITLGFRTPRASSEPFSGTFRVSSEPNQGRTFMDFLPILLTLSLGLYFLFSIINLWRADRIFNLGRNYLSSNQISTGYEASLKAVKLSPNEPLFRNQLAEATAKMAVLYHQSEATGSSKIRDQLINEAIKESNQVLAQNQVSLNFHKSKIKIYLLFATIDKKYYQNALEALLIAIDLAPSDAKLYYNLGLLYSQIGQTGLAEQTLVKTIELKQNYEAARYTLGSLYEQTNRDDLAKVQYQYILDNLNPNNQTVKEKLDTL